MNASYKVKFVLRLLLIVGLLLYALSSCKEKEKKSSSSVLHVAITDLHYDYTWDIHKIRGLYTHLVSYLISEPPIRMKSDGSYHPSLFKNWAFSEDKLSFIVEISDTFSFHDGTPVKADDVIFSLSKALDGADMQGGHNDLMNNLCSKKKSDIQKIDDNKLLFRLSVLLMPSCRALHFPNSLYSLNPITKMMIKSRS